jgi:uncharacterized lipoprotein YajG
MLKRVLLVVLCAATLAGCESHGDLTSDAFEPGDGMQSKFTLDAADCRADAELARNDNAEAIAAGSDQRHEMFNDALSACMTKHGYPRRDWSPLRPLPYSFNGQSE